MLGVVGGGRSNAAPIPIPWFVLHAMMVGNELGSSQFEEYSMPLELDK